MAKKPSGGIGDSIVAGLREAVAFERGERPASVRRVARTARAATVDAAPEFDRERIQRVRARLRLSQPVFANLLNVSSDTVKKWEQGIRVPDGAARRLLQVTEEQPALMLGKVHGAIARK